ncbi:hypothetical protein BGX21_007090, partial [Mortierella sp. AD011]
AEHGIFIDGEDLEESTARLIFPKEERREMYRMVSPNGVSKVEPHLVPLREGSDDDFISMSSDTTCVHKVRENPSTILNRIFSDDDDDEDTISNGNDYNDDSEDNGNDYNDDNEDNDNNDSSSSNSDHSDDDDDNGDPCKQVIIIGKEYSNMSKIPELEQPKDPKTWIPEVRTQFDSESKARNFIERWAAQVGFNIRIGRSRRNIGSNDK